MRSYILIFFLITISEASQVTFIVNMARETVVAGDGNYPAVYVSGANLNGPNGIEMINNSDGTWELTIELSPGEYTYKFRNGFYDYWDSPGWEGDNELINGGCAFGEYFDRLLIVEDNDITEGIYCFESCDEYCSEESSTEYSLIWNDEFEGNGSIDTSKWHHQTQLPNGNSWFNGEIQHYTDRLDNSYVSNGTLKIVAKKETYTNQGHTKDYTSARLNSKYAFTYGKIEARAKLPEGVGTWPAIWMLGQNIDELGAYWQTQGYGSAPWPQCGEIDIMEHWGSNQNYVQSALHTPSSYGGTINHGGQYIPNATSQFNLYTLEWNEEKMIFSVNGNEHYTYQPNNQNMETWPFNSPQFLLMNIAIEPGIESNFIQTELEIDYIRIYEQITLENKLNTLPLQFKNYQNFPNPFNPSTILKYDLLKDSFVDITVYDMLGNVVNNLVNKSQNSGSHSVQWDATNNQGESVSAGVYLYKIQAGEFSQTKKMILLK